MTGTAKIKAEEYEFVFDLRRDKASYTNEKVMEYCNMIWKHSNRTVASVRYMQEKMKNLAPYNQRTPFPSYALTEALRKACGKSQVARLAREFYGLQYDTLSETFTQPPQQHFNHAAQHAPAPVFASQNRAIADTQRSLNGKGHPGVQAATKSSPQEVTDGQAQQSSVSKRTRSCDSCRDLRVRCDGGLGSCNSCLRLNLKCVSTAFKSRAPDPMQEAGMSSWNPSSSMSPPIDMNRQSFYDAATASLPSTSPRNQVSGFNSAPSPGMYRQPSPAAIANDNRQRKQMSQAAAGRVPLPVPDNSMRAPPLPAHQRQQPSQHSQYRQMPLSNHSYQGTSRSPSQASSMFAAPDGEKRGSNARRRPPAPGSFEEAQEIQKLRYQSDLRNDQHKKMMRGEAREEAKAGAQVEAQTEENAGRRPHMTGISRASPRAVQNTLNPISVLNHSFDPASQQSGSPSREQYPNKPASNAGYGPSTDRNQPRQRQPYHTAASRKFPQDNTIGAFNRSPQFASSRQFNLPGPSKAFDLPGPTSSSEGPASYLEQFNSVFDSIDAGSSFNTIEQSRSSAFQNSNKMTDDNFHKDDFRDHVSPPFTDQMSSSRHTRPEDQISGPSFNTGSPRTAFNSSLSAPYATHPPKDNGSYPGTMNAGGQDGTRTNFSPGIQFSEFMTDEKFVADVGSQNFGDDYNFNDALDLPPPIVDPFSNAGNIESINQQTHMTAKPQDDMQDYMFNPNELINPMQAGIPGSYGQYYNTPAKRQSAQSSGNGYASFPSAYPLVSPKTFTTGSNLNFDFTGNDIQQNDHSYQGQATASPGNVLIDFSNFTEPENQQDLQDQLTYRPEDALPASTVSYHQRAYDQRVTDARAHGVPVASPDSFTTENPTPGFTPAHNHRPGTYADNPTVGDPRLRGPHGRRGGRAMPEEFSFLNDMEQFMATDTASHNMTSMHPNSRPNSTLSSGLGSYAAPARSSYETFIDPYPAPTSLPQMETKHEKIARLFADHNKRKNPPEDEDSQNTTFKSRKLTSYIAPPANTLARLDYENDEEYEQRKRHQNDPEDRLMYDESGQNVIGIYNGASAFDTSNPTVPTWAQDAPQPIDNMGGMRPTKVWANAPMRGRADAAEQAEIDSGELIDLYDHIAEIQGRPAATAPTQVITAAFETRPIETGPIKTEVAETGLAEADDGELGSLFEDPEEIQARATELAAFAETRRQENAVATELAHIEAGTEDYDTLFGLEPGEFDEYFAQADIRLLAADEAERATAAFAAATLARDDAAKPETDAANAEAEAEEVGPAKETAVERKKRRDKLRWLSKRGSWHSGELTDNEADAEGGEHVETALERLKRRDKLRWHGYEGSVHSAPLTDTE